MRHEKRLPIILKKIRPAHEEGTPSVRMEVGAPREGVWARLKEGFGSMKVEIPQEAVEEVAQDMVNRWATQFIQKLIPVADAFWKSKQKLDQTPSEQLPVALKNLGRNLDGGLDGLIEAGFEIQDHTGSPYVDGMATEVLAFQPMDGLGSRVIVETLKPTLFFRNQMVRRGQVIVGIPKDNAE